MRLYLDPLIHRMHTLSRPCPRWYKPIDIFGQVLVANRVRVTRHNNFPNRHDCFAGERGCGLEDLPNDACEECPDRICGRGWRDREKRDLTL